VKVAQPSITDLTLKTNLSSSFCESGHYEIQYYIVPVIRHSSNTSPAQIHHFAKPPLIRGWALNLAN
jgi:hypothetical protein